MDKEHYDELVKTLDTKISEGLLSGKTVFLFGHCNATEVLLGELKKRGYSVEAILDNNASKHGMSFEGVLITSPEKALGFEKGTTVTLIAARAYSPMASQLRRLGYEDLVVKIVDYDSFSDYSLSDETVKRMRSRLERGLSRLSGADDEFRVYCPFPAFGDVFYAMSYLPYYLQQKGIEIFSVSVVGKACASVAGMFGIKKLRILSRQEMDEEVQTALFLRDGKAFVAHNDKPYVTDQTMALSKKLFTFEEIYKCGVYALPKDTVPYRPAVIKKCNDERIVLGKSLILSPYAKSVSNIDEGIWDSIILEYKEKGFKVFTNVSGDEEPLHDTERLFLPLDEMQDACERAGFFIGLRSGLCDVIKYAKCRKTALYPDQYFSTSPYKMAEVFQLEGWENRVV